MTANNEQIVVTRRSGGGKLHVDAVPKGTVLRVAVNTQHWWVVDAAENGLPDAGEIPFIWIPKRCARAVVSGSRAA